MPIVTKLHSSNPDCRRYRIEGGDIAPDWAESHAKYVAQGGEPAVYCEISIWFYGNTIGSSGGTVWPGAWPELFDCQRGTAQTGPQTFIREAGLRLIADAERAAHAAQPTEAMRLVGARYSKCGLVALVTARGRRGCCRSSGTKVGPPRANVEHAHSCLACGHAAERSTTYRGTQ